MAGGVPGPHLLLEQRHLGGVFRRLGGQVLVPKIRLVEDGLKVAGETLALRRDPPRIDLARPHARRDKQVPHVHQTQRHGIGYRAGQAQPAQKFAGLIRVKPLVDVYRQGHLLVIGNLLDVHAAVETDGNGRPGKAGVVRDRRIDLPLARDVLHQIRRPGQSPVDLLPADPLQLLLGGHVVLHDNDRAGLASPPREHVGLDQGLAAPAGHRLADFSPSRLARQVLRRGNVKCLGQVLQKVKLRRLRCHDLSFRYRCVRFQPRG